MILSNHQEGRNGRTTMAGQDGQPQRTMKVVRTKGTEFFSRIILPLNFETTFG